MKRFFLLCAVVLTATFAYAGHQPGHGKGDKPAVAQTSHARAQAQAPQAAPSAEAAEATAAPSQQHLTSTEEAKVPTRQDVREQRQQLRQGIKDIRKSTQLPDQVKKFLIIGVVLILIGALLMFIPGLQWLGSTVGAIGVILVIVALLIYLINYA